LYYFTCRSLIDRIKTVLRAVDFSGFSLDNPDFIPIISSTKKILITFLSGVKNER